MWHFPWLDFRYNLEVIEEQFGPIIRGIVEDRLLLERLPEPTSSASYLAIRQVREQGAGSELCSVRGAMISKRTHQIINRNGGPWKTTQRYYERLYSIRSMTGAKTSVVVVVAVVILPVR